MLSNACVRRGSIFRCEPTEAEARAAYDRILSKLDGIGIDEVAALPLMTDPTSRAILEVLGEVHLCAAAVVRDMQILIVCAAIDLILERGVHDSSCLCLRMAGLPGGVALRRLRSSAFASASLVMN